MKKLKSVNVLMILTLLFGFGSPAQAEEMAVPAPESQKPVVEALKPVNLPPQPAGNFLPSIDLGDYPLKVPTPSGSNYADEDFVEMKEMKLSLAEPVKPGQAKPAPRAGEVVSESKPNPPVNWADHLLPSNSNYADDIVEKKDFKKDFNK